jgi:hypothetical protein
MPSWKDFLEQLSAIRAAPIPFFIAALAAIGISWGAINWSYSTLLTNAKSQIDLLDQKVSDYKDKLSGALPAEARAQLDAMKRRVELLEAQTDRLASRHLSEHQKVILGEKLGLLPKDVKSFTSVAFDMGCSDCQRYASEIAREISSVRGWENTIISNATMLVLGTPGNIPVPGGIEIKMPDPDHLSQEQKVLIDAFCEPRLSLEPLPCLKYLTISATSQSLSVTRPPLMT